MISETLKRNRKTLLIQFVVGMVVGATGAIVVLSFGRDIGLERSHEPALLLALLLVAVGLFIVVGSLTRSGAAQMLGADIEPGEDIATELNLVRWQGVAGFLAGAELLILSLDPALLGGPARAWLLPLLLLILAAQSWINLLLLPPYGALLALGCVAHHRALRRAQSAPGASSA